jgi:hypothetical protein
MWHANTKVEKKEAPLGKSLIPRLFQYKEGSVRLSEMRLFARLNDFMGKVGGLPWSMKGDVFDKAEKIVSAFEEFDEPAAVEIEATKWDGHFEDWMFFKVREMEYKILLAGKNGKTAAEVLKATTGVDAFGTSWMCSGDLIEFTRASMKSGGHNTSSGNKGGNVPIALVLVKMAGNFETFEEVLKHARFSCEGDDLLIVGEKKLMRKVLQLRNWVYAQAGFPQRSSFQLFTTPEETRFCSHGATRIAPGVCVPIRDLKEVFGRLCVPLANNAFALDFNSASRSLSSAISLCATYWYLPEIRHYWETVRKLIPKSVVVKGADRAEKWKQVHNLGVVDMVNFDVKSFVMNRFGKFPEVNLSKVALTQLNINSFAGLADLTGETTAKKLLSRGPNPFANSEVVFWYSSGITGSEALADFRSVSSKLNASMVVETSSQLREVLLKGSVDFPAGWRSLRATIGSTKCPLVAVFGYLESSKTEAISQMFDKKQLARDGFRGPSFTVYQMGQLGSSKFVKTSVLLVSAIMGFVGLLVMLSSFCVGSLQPGKTAAVRPGLEVESDKGVVLTTHVAIARWIVEGTQRVGTIFPKGYHARALYSKFVAARRGRVTMTATAAYNGLSYMVSNHRRFGLVKFDKFGNYSAALIYMRNYTDRELEREKWLSLDDFKDMVGNELLPAKNWTYNGGMLTVKPWSGTMKFGQFERPQLLFSELEGSCKSCFFFVRIDDCPQMRKDDKHPNPYVHPDLRVTPVVNTVPVFGENTNPGYLDIPKPFDSDILGRGSNNFIPWKSKQQKAVFRGGITGMGGMESNNARIWLEKNYGDNPMCDIGFTSAIDRICVSLDQEIATKPSYDWVPRMSYLEMGAHQVIFVVEGNECADRLAMCMETGSLVIYVKPKFCVGYQSWWSGALRDKYNVVMAELTKESIDAALAFVKENQDRCEAIAENGRRLALKLLDPVFQQQYMLGLMYELDEVGTLNSVSEVLKVKTITHGRHALVVKDADFSYTHGTVLSLEAASTTYDKCDMDIGCGIGLFEFSVAQSLNLQHDRTALKPGTEKLLSAELEKARMICTTANFSEDDANILISRLGTLGQGNHFAESVSNGLEMLLLVHTGCRGFISIWIERNVKDPGGKVGPKLFRVMKLAEEFAELNRAVCARLLGAGKLKMQAVHDKAYPKGEISGIDGPTLVAGLLVNATEALVLGGPGTGVALLSSQAQLTPHGVGGKGGRVRNLKNIENHLWYKTCERIGNEG